MKEKLKLIALISEEISVLAYDCIRFSYPLNGVISQRNKDVLLHKLDDIIFVIEDTLKGI